MKSFFKKIIIFIIEIEAKAVLKKYKPKIIAITGSVGKTTTKEAVYSVINTNFFARKSQKSFNSEIGVPLTILDLQNAWSSPSKWIKNIAEGLKLILTKNHYPKWLVLEVGADRPGDIKRISKWLKPDIVVMTKIPETPVHIEFFPSLDDLIEEKFALVKNMKGEGVLIINGDDKKLMSLKHKAPGKYITYGFSEDCAVRAEEDNYLYEKNKVVGMNFKVNSWGSIIPINIRGTLGHQLVYCALAGVAVGITEGVNMVKIAKSFENYEHPPGRMKLIEGKNESIIIDDSYNSSPIALHNALNTIDELINTDGRKITFLGDMLEIGAHSSREHKKAGELASNKIDILITIGLRAKKIAEGARENNKNVKVFEFDESKEVIDWLRENSEDVPKKDDLILVKGSQSIRTEKITEALMVNLKEKEKLLPRQESEWKKR